MTALRPRSAARILWSTPNGEERARLPWLRAVRDAGRGDRQEYRSFLRRSLQRHPVLSAVWTSFLLALVGVGFVRIVDRDADWATPVWLLLLVASFACWVLLVRRSEPDEPVRAEPPAPSG